MEKNSLAVINKFSLSALLLLLVLATFAGTARGYYVEDPTPPLAWEDIPKCELVIVAVYAKSNKPAVTSIPASFTLKVERIIKGDGVKVGDEISVDIDGRYIVMNGGEGINPKTNEKIIIPPQLGRSDKGRFQDLTKGVGHNPILPDLNTPTLYFFPSKNRPMLKQWGQVQDPKDADSWGHVIAGKPTDVVFRIGQTISSDISKAALKELHDSRDPNDLKRFVKGCFDPGNPAAMHSSPRWFTAVGDKDGDVFNPLLECFDKRKPGTNASWAIAQSMAVVDTKRAGSEFIKRATEEPLKDDALYQLRWVAHEDAINFLLERLATVDRPAIALFALKSILHSSKFMGSTPDITKEELARLRQLATPKLQALLNSDKLDAETKDEIKEGFPFLMFTSPATTAPNR